MSENHRGPVEDAKFAVDKKNAVFVHDKSRKFVQYVPVAHHMERIIQILEERNPFVLYLLAVSGAVGATCLFAVAFSYLFFGHFMAEFLAAGFCISLVVSAFLSYVFVALIRHLHALKCHVENLAATDDLTGVLNRRMYEITVRQELARCQRYTQPLVLIMIDIDHFKNINDSLGHTRGDMVLQCVSATIAANLRASDYLFRYGGEEFVVLSPQTDLAGAHILADRIKANVECLRIPGVPRLTISLGLVSSQDDMDSRAMLEKADEALYMAKTRGRNRIELAL